MFCSNCGTKNDDGAKFCISCGQPLGGNEDGVKKNVSQTNTVGNIEGELNESDLTTNVDMPKAPKKKKKALPKILIIVAAVAVVAAVAIICVSINLSRTINLNKYLNVEVEGYNGYGSAKVTVDWDAIEKKYGPKLSLTAAAPNNYGLFFYQTTPIDVIQDCVRVNLDQNSGLSNGDVISYTWYIDEKLTKYVNCKVNFKDGNYTVSGLDEVGTFDAFADLTVEFYGVEPDGSMKFEYNGSEMSTLDFHSDKKEGLSNGDTVKISIDESNLEYYVENFGKIPAEYEKEYQVEGLDKYLSELKEIDDDTLESMKQQALDGYDTSKWSSNESLESFTYVGAYLLTAKEMKPDAYFYSWFANNYLYLIFKAQVRDIYSYNGKSYDEINDIYWYIRYDDILVESDGTVDIDVTNYSTPSNRVMIDSKISDGWWFTKTWYYYGYSSLDNLYNGVITSNMDSFNYEVDVDESLTQE